MTPKEQKAYDKALSRIEACRRKGESGTQLDLSGLGLSALPPEIGQLTALTELFLHGNPLLALPPSVLGPEPEECKPHAQLDPARPADILDYYFNTRGKEGRALREVKVIFVGRGEVGKWEKAAWSMRCTGRNSPRTARARTAFPSPACR